MENFLKSYKEIIAFMLGYWFICLLMFFQDISFLYVMLSWNVLLAVLPLLFMYKSEMNIKKDKLIYSAFWMVAWLFFFPNSLYMVTDLIHISGDKFMWAAEVNRYSAASSVIYSNNILLWAKLLIIGFGFLFSLLVGLESFYIFEQNMRAMTSKKLSFLGIFLGSLLSAIGVYIGRFFRFNSWDIIFNPIQLLKEIITGINIFTIQFTTIFTIFTVACYILYKIFRRIALH